MVGVFFVGYRLLVLTAAGFIYGIATFISASSKKKQMQQSCDAKIKATSETMQKIFAEFGQYQNELRSYDAYHTKVLDALHKI